MRIGVRSGIISARGTQRTPVGLRFPVDYNFCGDILCLNVGGMCLVLREHVGEPPLFRLQPGLWAGKHLRPTHQLKTVTPLVAGGRGGVFR